MCVSVGGATIAYKARHGMASTSASVTSQSPVGSSMLTAAANGQSPSLPVASPSPTSVRTKDRFLLNVRCSFVNIPLNQRGTFFSVASSCSKMMRNFSDASSSVCMSAWSSSYCPHSLSRNAWLRRKNHYDAMAVQNGLFYEPQNVSTWRQVLEVCANVVTTSTPS